MLSYPGARGLIVRKTRVSLNEAGLYTFEQFLLNSDDPLLLGRSGRPIGRAARRAYEYPNGSMLIVGGIDKETRILSTEFDLIFVQEAIEFTENEWETLTTRLRHGRTPVQQIIADTNPGAPTHWIKRRANSGQLELIESRHEDNPSLYNHKRKKWTQRGIEYLERLSTLTGHRLERFRYGRWVQAEGAIYTNFIPSLHLLDFTQLVERGIFTKAGKLNAGVVRRVVASVDWGFTHAGVIQVWVEDNDGRLYLIREIYQTGQQVNPWWVRQARRLQREFKVSRFICDPAEPSFIEHFRRKGLKAEPANNEVLVGIQAVQARLEPAPDGLPRLFLYRDSLESVDHELMGVKLPVRTEDEFSSYVWRKSTRGDMKEAPEKANDHGMDAMRYAVMYFDFQHPTSVRSTPINIYKSRLRRGDTKASPRTGRRKGRRKDAPGSW